MKKNKLVQIGRIVLSFLFVFGAVSKLVSMPFFDGMVAELLLGKDYFDQPDAMRWVQWITRILVAAELLLGLALLQNKWFKKVVLPATLGMLVLFTIHLFYEGFRQENGFIEGNCGCFGDVLPMTNLESIIKNVIGMLFGVIIWIKYKAEDQFSSWVAPVLLGAITLFTLSFGVKSYVSNTEVTTNLGTAYPAEVDSADSLISLADTAIEENVPDELEEVQAPDTKTAASEPDKTPVKTTPKVEAPKEETPSDITLKLLRTYAPDIASQGIDKNTRLVCLFSMTCSHCQEVYRDLSAMKSSGKLPQMYLVNYGTEYEQNYFFTQAGDSKDAHTRTEDFVNFKRMLQGKTYPRLLYIKNGKIVNGWDVDTYQKESFMKYFGIEKLVEKSDGGGLQLELNEGDSPW